MTRFCWIAGKLYSVTHVLAVDSTTPEDVAFLEGFEFRLAVAIEFYLDPVEMIKPALDRQVLRPVIRDALIFDALADRDAANPLRARAEGRLEASRHRNHGCKPGLRENGHRAGNIEYRTIGMLAGEGHAQRVIVLGNDFLHLGQKQQKLRVSLLLYGLEAEDRVMRGQGRAVVKSCFVAQFESEGVAVIQRRSRFPPPDHKWNRVRPVLSHQRVVAKSPCAAARHPWRKRCSAC